MPHTRLRLACAAVALALPLAAGAPAAHADGDPAGDVLAQQSVFYGSALDLRSKEAAQLPALLAQSKAKGYEIRVAALSVQPDLGAIDYLWDDPLNYAEFLGQELAYIYTGRTLVVMPSGYAVFRVGHSSLRDQRVVDKVDPPGEEASKVLPGAIEAVVALAAARGIELTVPDVEPPPGGVKQPGSHFGGTAVQAPTTGRPTSRPVSSSGGGGGWLFALPLLGVVVAAGFLLGRRVLGRSR